MFRLDFMLVVSDCNIEAKLALYVKHGDSGWFFFSLILVTSLILGLSRV